MIYTLLPTVVGSDSAGEFEYLVDGIYEKLFSITGNEEYRNQIGIHQQKYNELADPHIYHSVFFDGIVFEKKNPFTIWPAHIKRKGLIFYENRHHRL